MARLLPVYDSFTTAQPFNLVPGENIVPTEFHYEPANANDTVAQSFLTAFLTGDSDLPLTIQGDLESSPFESLAPALSSLTLSTSLQGEPCSATEGSPS
jgi:hypothetical protein